jgi:uroporphyrinogen-III decarboxylase
MTDQQWQNLLDIIRGETPDALPSGFVIDSPWLPNWYGVNILDYFSNDEIWLEANLKVLREFPETMFLPGFWSEYGMCTEPSAFGARSSFPVNEFPHAHKVIHSAEEIDTLEVPNPATDGLLPFVLNRLRLAEPKIQEAGHNIRFAVARGPLNIASYLMGSTEFLMAMMMMPDRAHRLMRIITDFLNAWIDLQMKTFPTIDGIFLLDDIIGFIGDTEFRTFGLPYFKELYDKDVSVKFLHNDAPCKVSAPYLPEIGINLFNMGFEVNLNEMKEITGNSVTMLGNIPPRDVLASATPDEVEQASRSLVESLGNPSRVIFSCGGGMPPGVSSENIQAFLKGIA